MEKLNTINEIIKKAKLNNSLSLISNQTKISGILKDIDTIGEKEFLILENPFINDQISNFDEIFVFVDEIETIPVA